MDSSNALRGTQLFELGRYKEAISYLSEDMEDATSRFYLAYCYYHLDQPDKAEDLANDLLSEMPEDPDMFSLKARIAIQKDQYTEALQFINEAISLDPNSSDQFGLKGGVFLQKKQFQDALLQVNKGLEIDPRNAYCLNLRAQVLTKLNRKEEASETVENILYENPEDSFSHANVGWVALENGDTQKALNHFKQSLQLDPNDGYAQEGMSTALKSKNIIYKWYLKYSFWMSNKSTKSQWVFIIGIYLAYRFGIKLLSSSGFSHLIVPLVIVYLTFAMSGWIMESLSNAILNFDSYGKYLLNKNEKRSGYTFATLLGLGLVSVITFYILKDDYFLLLAVTFFCALIPFPRAFLSQKEKGRIFGIAYSILMLVIGTLGFLVVPNLYSLGITVFIMLIAFTWIGNAFE
jgi:tetratricopeptide (TPR) repeat protein